MKIVDILVPVTKAENTEDNEKILKVSIILQI